MDDIILGLQNVGSVSIIDFLIGLFEIIFISVIYKLIYDKYSDSVSERSRFSFQFIPFSISIFLIVVTIKSSLVLSLGLVGALSIIRFRTAIKEPEQILSLLYLTGVSIAIAANKFIIPLITTLLIFIFFIIRKHFLNQNYSSSGNFILIKMPSCDESKIDIVIKNLQLILNSSVELKSIQNKDQSLQLILIISNFDLQKLKLIINEFEINNLKIDEYTLY